MKIGVRKIEFENRIKQFNPKIIYVYNRGFFFPFGSYKLIFEHEGNKIIFKTSCLDCVYDIKRKFSEITYIEEKW